QPEAGPDDPVRAEEMASGVDEVHAAAPAARAAVRLAEQLGHDLARRQALGQGVVVAAVGSRHDVVRPQSLRGADRHALLAGRGVDAARDLARQGQPDRLRLELADDEHLLQPVTQYRWWRRLYLSLFGGRRGCFAHWSPSPAQVRKARNSRSNASSTSAARSPSK